MANARSFDNTDDRITVSAAAFDGVGAPITLAAVVRRLTDVDGSEIICMYVGSGSSGAAQDLYIDGSGDELAYWNDNTENDAPTITLENADGWAIVVITKASGTVAPRFHMMPIGGSWTHENGGSTSTDASDQTVTGFIEFGRDLGAPYVGNMDLAVAGVWDVALSDAQVEELGANLATADWNDNSGGAPVGLWDFNQASTTTAVEDLTAGGSDQTAIVGTTVVSDGPAGWTHGLAAPESTVKTLAALGVG